MITKHDKKETDTTFGFDFVTLKQVWWFKACAILALLVGFFLLAAFSVQAIIVAFAILQTPTGLSQFILLMACIPMAFLSLFGWIVFVLASKKIVSWYKTG
jgi:hypothetical protein